MKYEIDRYGSVKFDCATISADREGNLMIDADDVEVISMAFVNKEIANSAIDVLKRIADCEYYNGLSGNMNFELLQRIAQMWIKENNV